MKQLYIFLIITVLFTFNSTGQTSEVFGHLDISSGLSDGSVTSIIQDQRGFIWIGSKNGLNRYDGKEFKVYNTSNSNLIDDDISCLSVDKNGLVWIGTNGGGLYSYDPVQGGFVSYLNSDNKKNIIRSIYCDDAGIVWLATASGLVQVENGRLRSFDLKEQNESDLSSITGSNGVVWIGASSGLLIRVVIKNQKIGIVQTPDNATINALLPKSGEELIVGTNEIGLLRFNTIKNTFNSIPLEENPSVIRDILIDQKHNIWVCTDGNGVYYLNESFSQIKHLKHNTNINSSLISNAVYKVYEDNDHNLWFGTAWDGLAYRSSNYRNVDFYFSDFEGSNSVGVLSVLVENDKIWIGSDGSGLKVYDKQRNQVLQHPLISQVPSNAYIQYVEKMGDGYYWIGTYRNGLYRINLETNQYHHYSHDPDRAYTISHNNVRGASQITDRLYFVATWGGGLNILDITTGSMSLYSNSLSSKDLTAIRKDQIGNYWVASFGGGIDKIDYTKNQINNISSIASKDNTLSSNNVVALLVEENQVWAGCWGTGLNRIQIQTNEVERMKDGQYPIDLTITSIERDDYGQLWLSTKEGIAQYDNEERLKFYGALREAYHINSSTIGTNGELYFGNRKGLISFLPRKISVNPKIPKVQITDIKLFNQSIYDTESSRVSQVKNDNEGLVLSHNENVITFDYSALIFPNSQDVEYRIMVENLHDEWVYLGQQNTLTLTGLAANDYKVRIGAAVRGHWDDEMDAVLKFTVLKPWWKTIWAAITYTIIFLLLMYLFRKYAVRWEKLKSQLEIETVSREKESEINSIKQKFFTNISHEIRTPMTLIMGAINQIDSRGVTDKFTQDSLASVRKNGQHIIQLVNELLDFRKIDSNGVQLKVAEGNIVKFTHEIFLSFKPKADKLGINYSFKPTEPDIRMWYDRDQLEKVFYNLLSNAFKYTPSQGEILVEVTENDEHVFISVSDSGKGIPNEHLKNIFKRFYQSDNSVGLKQPGFGIGLSIVHDMVRLHGGIIDVSSKMGDGTSFVMKFSKGKDHFLPSQRIDDFLDSENPTVYQEETARLIDEKPANTTGIERSSVLVVEDNEEIRAYLKTILDGEFQISEASNGQEGLDYLKNQELPDLIISDVMMPVMDGITMTEKIKSDRTTSHIPVIILTARTGLIYKKEGFETGADEYIVKPFNDAMLKTRVRGILKNREIFKEKLKNDLLIAPKELALNTPDQQFLEDLVTIIDNNINADKLNAEFLASELGMSHSVVYKKIKSMTGQTLVEFVRDYRLKRSAQLMTKYQLSISEACYKVGFSDRKYFSQVFKKKFGVTPTDYISKNKQM